ncbi:MAG: hypothetical protein ACREFX_06630 [Opitutaceae bacterium]
MPVWEYKVISSGKGGFATPALLESFLNQLGKEDWEIINYQSPSDNPLAFHGLARRSTQRDWTLEDAAAAAARAETEKLRAEFEAKFRGMAAAGGTTEEKPETPGEAKPEPEDGGYRKPRDTDRDMDADAEEEEADDWDKLAAEEELPTLFEAIQPLMRRNPKGAGMSVGVDQLARKWHLSEDDVLGGLKECGFVIPDDEDAKPDYIEYDGDLFWVNVNRRGELWINTKEKPRPVFRIAQGNRIVPERADAATGESAPGGDGPGGESAQSEDAPPEASAKPVAGSGSRLPEGEALLKRIRPLMRRGRGGASGSFGFLSRALKCREADLAEAFQALGLAVPTEASQSSSRIELGDRAWWLNLDQRGTVWINEGRREPGGSDGGAAPDSGEATPRGETPQTDESAFPRSEPAATGEEVAAAPGPVTEGAAAAEPDAERTADGAEAAPAPAEVSAEADELLAAVRPLLKESRSGGLIGEICTLAESLGRNPERMLQVLSGFGLRIPEKPREKAVEVERTGSLYWLTRNAKDEIWLNAREAGAVEDGAERKPRRARRSASSVPSEPTPSE